MNRSARNIYLFDALLKKLKSESLHKQAGRIMNKLQAKNLCKSTIFIPGRTKPLTKHVEDSMLSL